MQQRAAMAIGIVDILDGLPDPLDHPLRELERQACAPTRRKIGDGVEHRIHIGGPAGHLAITDIAPRACRTIDRLVQPCLECLVVGMRGRCGHVQPAEQDRVALGRIHDHPDKRTDALFLQVIAYLRERAGAFRLRIAACGIGRQRRRDHVLAESPIVEAERLVHKSASGGYFITSSGEAHLDKQLESDGVFAKG